MYFVQKTYVFELKNHGFSLKKHRFFKNKVPKEFVFLRYSNCKEYFYYLCTLI